METNDRFKLTYPGDMLKAKCNMISWGGFDSKGEGSEWILTNQVYTVISVDLLESGIRIILIGKHEGFVYSTCKQKNFHNNWISIIN